MSKPRTPLAYTDNFWSILRVENGYRISDLAELCGISAKVMSTYFTGQCIPPDSVIKTLCEYFDVDLEKGALEFQRANRAYNPKHTRTLVCSSKNSKSLLTAVEPVANQDNVSEEFSEIHTFSYPQVVALLENRKDAVLRVVFDKVDFETYRAIERAFECKL